MADVAREAAVALGTVSRVINGQKVGEEFKTKVEEAIERLGYQYDKSNFKVNAVLQNYAYNKSVFVRYTTDGWKSYNDKALNYSKTNANGTETWTTDLNLANYSNASDFQYAICYRVYGTEYWANNFGKNYDGLYYIHH